MEVIAALIGAIGAIILGGGIYTLVSKMMNGPNRDLRKTTSPTVTMALIIYF